MLLTASTELTVVMNDNNTGLEKPLESYLTPPPFLTPRRARQRFGHSTLPSVQYPNASWPRHPNLHLIAPILASRHLGTSEVVKSSARQCNFTKGLVGAAIVVGEMIVMTISPVHLFLLTAPRPQSKEVIQVLRLRFD